MTTPKPPVYVTPQALAELLGISDQTVYRKIDDGDFPGSIRVGRLIRIPLRSVRTYLGEHEIQRGDLSGGAA